jgi:hypothetical protein
MITGDASIPRSAGRQSAPKALLATIWLVRWGYVLAPALVALAVGLVFTLGQHGTPDDDGYIYYQYARNLADGHGLSFNPGQASFGVTGGAWVFLLAAFHMLVRGDLASEGQYLGLVLFALSAALWALAVARWSGRSWLGLASALVYVLELDALKLSLNGLETALAFAVLAAVALSLASTRLDRPFVTGALCGLAVLTRPDGVALLVAAGCVAVFAGLALRELLGRLLALGGAALAVALPWYGWVWAATGSPVPPTQTGKLMVFLPLNNGITLAEYHAMNAAERLGFGLTSLASFIRSGGPSVWAAAGGFIMLAVLLVVVARGRQSRPFAAWPGLLALAVAIQVLLYAWAFPLVKLRYIANLLPVGLVLSAGALGLLWSMYRRALNLPSPSQAARLVGAGLLLATAVGGAYLYAREIRRQANNYHYYVAAEGVLGGVGSWLRANTPAESVVALEPIGAVAFHSNRQVLDLGGLTDPSTWPALANGFGDGKALAELLKARNADYLVDYTQPQGVGGASNALKYLPGARKVAVIESSEVLAGTRAEYGSYTVYSLKTK